MASEKQRPRWGGIALSVVGIVLLIVGVLWLTVIFPALAKIPTGYESTYYFEGTFSAFNPATQSMVSFPVTQTMAQEATGTQDGALLIHEKRTVINAGDGSDITATYGDESTLAIDRSTRKFVETIDERGRTGYWAPPMGLGEGDSFEMWSPSAGKPLTVRYVKTEEFSGLTVVVFQMTESDLPIGTHPQTQAPLLLTTTVNLIIEPKTGTVVDQDALTITSMDMGGGQKVAVQIADVTWTEGTVSDLVAVAKDGMQKLLLFETIVPWLLVGVGAVLFILGVILIVARRHRAPVDRRRGTPVARRRRATA